MSTAIYNAKAAAFAAKQDALRDVFGLDGNRVFLLKRDGQSGTKYTNLGELTSGVRIQFDNNRAESGLFRYAVVDIDSFRDTWAECSHVAYGVPNGSGEIEVYAWASSPETGVEKDRIDPDVSSIYFAGRIVRLPQERYTIV